MIATAMVLENRSTLDGLADHIERWVLSSRILGADTLVIVDQTSYRIGHGHDRGGDSSVNVLVVDSIDEIKGVLPKSTKVVWVEEGDGTALPDYKHPGGNVVYVFGGDIAGLPSNKAVTRLSVPCGAAWPEAIMAIVLYDRMMKS